jgi:hypothetical protein
MFRKLSIRWFALVPALALVIGAGTASASLPNATPPALQGIGTEPSAGLLNSGLLNLSRFDIHNSLSYSFSSSSEFGSQSGGLWQTEIGYRISDPLRISLDVGATLDPSSQNLFSEKNIFLRGFNLDYRPNRNFQLNVSYVNTPPAAARALGYRGWLYPGGVRPYGSPLSMGR